MQTFLPYPDFERSLRLLDTQRAYNQVNECKSIAIALLKNRGWIHHPATKMWCGYERALFMYALTADVVAQDRGRAHNPAMDYFRENLGPLDSTPAMPPWLGDSVFHLSHQSNLKRKGVCSFDVPSNVEYAWPRLDGAGGYTLELSAAGQRRVDAGITTDPRITFKGATL